MKKHFIVGASAMMAVLVSTALADDALKSGPQVGRPVAAFHPLHATGPNAGQKLCLV